MERHFDNSLRALKEKLILMAGKVEESLELVTSALVERNIQKLQNVDKIETEINLAHVEVDESCVQLLATQQPMAADLRLIVAVIKINSDLERMGDQAINIANNGRRYLDQTPLKPLVDLPIMAQNVRIMVRNALDSFVHKDSALAHHVLSSDDSVDELKNKIFRDVIDLTKAAPEKFEQGLNLILIARNLERIGDHATNIAEVVIFAISGQDIRHSGANHKKGALND